MNDKKNTGAAKTSKVDALCAAVIAGYQAKAPKALGERATGEIEREVRAAWGVVKGIIERKAMLTGIGRDGWGSSDTTRSHFIHEALFSAAFDYEGGALMPVYGALTGRQIHCFVVAAQVATGVETPDSITTPSATGAHIRTLCGAFYGVDAKGTRRQIHCDDPERASITSTGEGYKMNESFALSYLESKRERKELPPAKAPKGSKVKSKAGK